jgi:hypothetical protein
MVSGSENCPEAWQPIYHIEFRSQLRWLLNILQHEQLPQGS